ncbi:hypothetical protein Tco_1299402, partial [Tanacetum coccineum]
EGSSLEKKLKKHPSLADDSLRNQALLRTQLVQIQENKKRRDEHAEIIASTKSPMLGSSPRLSTTQARTLNEKSSKKIPPTTSQPPGWRVCRPMEGVSPGRRLCRQALGAYIFHFTLEET